MLVLLGLVMSKFPLGLDARTIKPATDIFLTVLRDQMDSARDKSPEMPVIAG